MEPSDFWRESGGTGKKITAGAAFPLWAGNSAKIWTPPHLKLRRPHPPRLTDPPSLLLRWALPGPLSGKGVGVQQALAAEGGHKHPARLFFFFFASADAVRA